MYHTEFMAEAEDDLARLPKALAQRVLNRLRWLAENFDVITPEPLTGPWRGVFKLRVGDYRVLYTFSRAEPPTITVHLIKHRREVYKTR